MTGSIQAFRDEVADLGALLRRMPEDAWPFITQFRGWSIEDVVLHLYASDHGALLSVTAPEAFDTLRADMRSRRDAGLTMIQESRERFPRPRGRTLLGQWTSQAGQLADQLETLDPATRLRWSGPSMSVRMFATARQMETWAHGHEVYDLLGAVRQEQDRIENVALLGVRTFGWSFSNRARAVPRVEPHVRLVLPSGKVWSMGDERSSARVNGSAVEFCQVVTQVRNIADTRLHVTGEVARDWMAIAQCFAGPPADPPPPGQRHIAVHQPSRTISAA